MCTTRVLPLESISLWHSKGALPCTLQDAFAWAASSFEYWTAFVHCCFIIHELNTEKVIYSYRAFLHITPRGVFPWAVSWSSLNPVCVWVTGCVFPGCSRPVSLVSPRGIGTLQECKNVTPLGSACALVPDCYWQKQTVNDFERAERERKLSRLLGRLSGLSTLLHIYLDTLIATEHGGSKELHELGSASWGTIRFPRHIALETNGTLSGGDAKLAGGGEWNPAQMRGGIFLKLFLWDRSRSSALSLVSSCWCFVFWPRGFILL